MILNQTEFNSFFASGLVLDCVSIVLKQQTNNSPKTYKGPGSIYQDPTGQLHLKMFHRFKKHREANDEAIRELTGVGLSLGKLISEDYFYSMTATDMSGRTWTAKHVRVHGHLSIPVAAQVIKTNLKSISYFRKPKNHVTKKRDPSFVIFVDPICQVPLNARTEPHQGQIRRKCTFNIAQHLCEIIRHEGYDQIEGALPQQRTALDYAKTVLRAVGIASGHYIAPRIVAITTHSGTTLTLYARSDRQPAGKLPLPFDCNMPHEVAHFERFVSAYVKAFPTENNTMLGYWIRLTGSIGGNIENMALVLTICIEGVLKNYYPQYGLPDSEYLKEVGHARKKLAKYKIGPRVKKRILDSLEGKKSFSAKGALIQLARDSVIPEMLIKPWQNLRNKSAHAATLEGSDEATQNLLDDCWSCLELFYVLLFRHIHYQGPIRRLSKPNWPIEQLETQHSQKA